MKAHYFRNFIFLTSIVFASQAQADAFDDCNSDDPALIISGCTEVIGLEDLPDEHKIIALGRRSDAYIATGKFDLAIDDRQLILEIEPESQEYQQRLISALLDKADALLVSGFFESAIAGYSAVLNFSNGSQTANHALIGRMEANLGIVSQTGQGWRFKDVLADLNTILEVNSRAASVSISEGTRKRSNLSFSEIGKLVQITRAFDAKAREFLLSRAKISVPRYATLVPNEAYKKLEAILSKSDLYGCRNNYVAPEICTVFNELKIGYIDLLLLEGKAQIRADHLTTARLRMNDVLKADPQNPDAMVLKGLIYEKQWEFSEAEKTYSRVLLLHPTNKNAEEGLQRIQRRHESIVRQIQLELRRIGCDPGPIDGKWGPKSRQALSLVGRYSGKDLRSWENRPTQDLLEILSGYSRDAGDACFYE